jgi:hypothetical protein
MFENAPGLLARCARKPGEKIGELCPVLKILEQGGDGNARAAEHPCSTYPGRIPLNGGTGRPIDHAGSLNAGAAQRNVCYFGCTQPDDIGR